jgi:hypothetical protein
MSDIKAFLLRVPAGVHAVLKTAAAQAGVSLNDYCVERLAAPIGDMSSLRGGSEAVLRAASLFGNGLIGAVAFGSWARGQAGDASDLDLLVVVEGSVALTRGLYRKWDEVPVVWGGRRVEPHFVHLPRPGVTAAGVWPEVAVDGIVLFERGLRVSARLNQVRRDIVEGRIVRRVAHGQPYWARVA